MKIEQVERIWVLGALDPEMAVIESILKGVGEHIEYATVQRDGQRRRVTPSEAYASDVSVGDGIRGLSATAYCVECRPHVLCGSGDGYIDWEGSVITIDHHQPGDPGFGRPPNEYLFASSIGQVLASLTMLWVFRGGRYPFDLLDLEELWLTAAADHCLGAAYRGECPGIDPDALKRWRVHTLAAFQGRPESEVMVDVAAEAETAALEEFEIFKGRSGAS